MGHVASADVLLCFLESYAIFTSLLKQKKIPPFSSTLLAMTSCWLAEEIRYLPVAERKDIVRKYSGVDLNFVLSENQIDILTDSGFDAERIESINFGFAPETFSFTPVQNAP